VGEPTSNSPAAALSSHAVAPPEPSTILHGVRWSEAFPVVTALAALRVAAQWRMLLLGWLTLWIVQGGWHAIDRWAARTQPCGVDLAVYQTLRDLSPTTARLAHRAGEVAPASAVALALADGPPVRPWTWLLQPLYRIVRGWEAASWASAHAAAAWALVVWAVLGGALARIAALRLTYGESLGLRAALRHARSHWVSSAGAAAAIYLLSAALLGSLAVAGAATRSSLGLLVVGACWGACLALAAALTLVAGGLVAGGPLLWAATAVERTDALDALSRTYAYLYQRPVRWLAYVATAAAAGWCAHFALRTLTWGVAALAQYGAALGAGPGFPSEVSTPGRLGAAALRGWLGAWQTLPEAFALAYLAASGVAIYLLLRQSVDAVDLQEASVDEV
jgi:hypothetical protein